MSKIYKQLSELGNIVTGKTPSTANNELWGGNIPFITPTDIKGYDTYYQEITERTISENGASKQKNTLLPPNSICVTCIGSTIGKPCITKNTSISNQQINSIVPNKDNDFRYIYYIIREGLPYFQLIGGGSGSGTPIISKNKFAKIKFPIETDLQTQRKIASILSSYDSLIENNTKRIRLLEQMAENLYKEWFVRFRFPGHENTEFVDGLPKGWEKDKLESICKFERGKNITSGEMKEGNIPVIAAGVAPSGFHNQANVHGTSITMSSSGANAGFIAIHYGDIWAADCSYISETSTKNIFYIYQLLDNLRVVITNMQRGAAQPHVYAKDINNLKICIPSKELRKAANDRLSAIHKQIYYLQQQSALLTRQRDLLLPRLMSGKLEVKAIKERPSK